MAGFGDMVQKAFYLGVGLASYAGEKAGGTLGELREQAQKLAAELVQRGEMSTEEARKFVEDVMQQGQQAARESSTQTTNKNKEPRQIEIIEDDEDESSNEKPEQVDRLRQQVDALKDELRRLQNEQQALAKRYRASNFLMEYWPNNDWFKMLETLASEVSTEVDRCFQELTEQVNEIVDEFLDLPEDILRDAEEIGEELNNIILADIEEFFQQFIDPVFEFEIEVDEGTTETEAEFFVNYVEPSPEQYAACVGCQHDRGYVYGGNLLVGGR